MPSKVSLKYVASKCSNPCIAAVPNVSSLGCKNLKSNLVTLSPFEPSS